MLQFECGTKNCTILMSKNSKIFICYFKLIDVISYERNLRFKIFAIQDDSCNLDNLKNWLDYFLFKSEADKCYVIVSENFEFFSKNS